MKTYQLHNKTLSLLGGGQLGQMLIQAAIPYNLKIEVLDPHKEAPCAALAHRFVQGDFADADEVLRFAEKSDFVSLEIEHVSCDALHELEKRGCLVFPPARVLEMVQDKGRQKQFYFENDIPTAAFEIIHGREDIKKQRDFLPCFQKLRRGGYDGKGVRAIRDLDDLPKAFDAPSVLEKAVKIQKEISVITVRRPSGEIAVYDPVEMVFDPEANLVDSLIAPAQIPEEKLDEARALALRLTEKLKPVGLLAVEMFLSKDNEILVNEIAPRPHNSGHHTIQAAFTSQFENHIRAILDLPLGSTALLKPAAMINLLGSEKASGECIVRGLDEVLAIKGVSVHLYNKKESQPKRKMGHVTLLADSLEQVKKNIVQVKSLMEVGP